MAAPQGNVPTGGETVQVVEDDARVRRLTMTRLKRLGYRGIGASNGPAALVLLRSPPQIDLILSDIVMPGGMTGFDVAKAALRMDPTPKLPLATGYASGQPQFRDDGDIRHPILRKPYRLMDLATQLRRLLG